MKSTKETRVWMPTLQCVGWQACGLTAVFPYWSAEITEYSVSTLIIAVYMLHTCEVSQVELVKSFGDCIHCGKMNTCLITVTWEGMELSLIQTVPHVSSYITTRLCNMVVVAVPHSYRGRLCWFFFKEKEKIGYGRQPSHLRKVCSFYQLFLPFDSSDEALWGFHWAHLRPSE